MALACAALSTRTAPRALLARHQTPQPGTAAGFLKAVEPGPEERVAPTSAHWMASRLVAVATARMYCGSAGMLSNADILLVFDDVLGVLSEMGVLGGCGVLGGLGM